jgi:hypothetical protein
MNMRGNQSWSRRLRGLLCVGAMASATGLACVSCTTARAEDGQAAPQERTDPAQSRAARRDAYRAALAEHDATTLDSAARAQAAIDEHRPACVADELEWQRFVDVFFCTTPCASDDDCLPEDRCTVLDLGVAADGVTPQFEVALHDGTLAAGLCDPFWEDVAPDVDAEDADLAGADE